MVNIGNLLSEMQFCKILAIAIPNFYRKTDINATLQFIHKKEDNSLEISLGFHPREPSKDEYNIFFEEIVDAENLLIGQSILSLTAGCDNLKQLIFKQQETINRVIAKNKGITNGTDK